MNIEYINGQESHSSRWGKFYVKGLEKWAAKEDYSTSHKHYSYQEWQANSIPEGTLFTIFWQYGNKNGTDDFQFYICETTAEYAELQDSYSKGYCKGNFKVIAQGNGKTRAPRLMDWWQKRPAGREREYAEECARMIKKRGQKDAPVLSDPGYREAPPLKILKSETTMILKMQKRYGNRLSEVIQEILSE